MAGGEPTDVHAKRSKFDSEHWNVYNALIEFDNDATGMILATRASGGRVLGAQLHAAGIGCYMDIPGLVTFLLDDSQKEKLPGMTLPM